MMYAIIYGKDELEKSTIKNLDNFFFTDMYLKWMCVQVCGLFIFMISKTPKDCFKCFSKATNIKYSIFQYVRFIYTE